MVEDAESPCGVDLVVHNLMSEHEKQLQQQQSKFEELRTLNGKLRADNTRLRDQREDRSKECETQNKNYVDLQNIHRDLEKQYTSLDKQYIFSDDRYKYLVGKIIGPYAQLTNIKWDEQSGATINVMIEPLIKDALDAGQLRNQVRALQNDMFARIDKGDPVSDEQFAQDFRNLAALIKTLSRTIRIAEEVDVIKILEDAYMLHGVAVHHWNSRARKKGLIEAWVWSILLWTVFDTPFSVLGLEGENVRKAWATMFGKDHAHEWPTPSSLCEDWRCTTAKIVFAKIAAQDAMVKPSDIDTLTTQEKSILERRDMVTQCMAAYFIELSPSMKPEPIRAIMDKAFALSVQMSMERSRFQVTYPAIGAPFDKDAMKPMRDPEGKDIEAGNVAFIANPGLTKWGDAHGRNLDHRYDIVPALVQLEPTAEKDVMDEPWSEVFKRGLPS